MDPMTYLMTPTTEFGALAWAFFIAQIIAAVAGIYLAFVRRDASPVRGEALRRLGYALLALGAAGLAVGALRLAAIDPFTARYWFYLVALFEIALAGFAFFYARVTYPNRLAEYEQANRSKAVRRSTPRPQPVLQASGNTANGNTPAIDTSRAAATTGRRGSRRDRKRRSR